MLGFVYKYCMKTPILKSNFCNQPHLLCTLMNGTHFVALHSGVSSENNLNASANNTSESDKTDSQPVRTYKKPVEWLPFAWHRIPKQNFYENSGDLVKKLEYDPSWPKPDFEWSEELKIASDEIKRKFSLASASKGEIKEVIKRKWLQKVQRHPLDTESLEAKIAVKTLQVRSLFEHRAAKIRDRRNSRFVLEILIKKRNKLLRLLRNEDTERFNWLTKELKLYYTPQVLGGKREFYCKKWDLRRLTKEYCEKIVQSKKEAYHEELKKQQADFVREKEEILAWIEKEEKELANMKV